MTINQVFNTVNNVFIVGMEKCGTTALAEWMVTSGLAQHRLPGMKEPNLYANDDVHAPQSYSTSLPLLDASVGYAGNADVFRRLPDHDTRIVICLRNQFERAWSAFKMLKTLGEDSAEIYAYFQSFEGRTQRFEADPDKVLCFWRSTVTRFFPRRSYEIVNQYTDKELHHIRTHTFRERLQYEIGFYLARRQFPIASIIWASFFYHPLRIALEKYRPSDISVVSVDRLVDDESRCRFVRSLFNRNVETPPVPFFFSSRDVKLTESKPDFDSKDFDLLRDCFRYDLAQARQLIPKTLLGDSMLDNEDLNRYGLSE